MADIEPDRKKMTQTQRRALLRVFHRTLDISELEASRALLDPAFLERRFREAFNVFRYRSPAAAHPPEYSERRGRQGW